MTARADRRPSKGSCLRWLPRVEHDPGMRTVIVPALALVFMLLTGCDAAVEPEVEPTPIVHVETRGDAWPIVGCCECMTADNITFWPECHSHKCEDQCVVGDPSKGCEWIDAELVCPEFVCP